MPPSAHSTQRSGTPAWTLVPCLVLLFVTAGCTAGAGTGGTLHHLVFFILDDASSLPELKADCLSLAALPGVIEAACGPPAGTDRPLINDDFDLCLALTFRNEAAYHAWLEHPDHVAASTKWKPRIASMSIIDFRD